MKKFIFYLLLSMSIATTFTACTEEEVKPTQTGGAGGIGTDPKG